jgi:hypothetical protein
MHEEKEYMHARCFHVGYAWHSIPWIPEPSTVNNKLKRREGSGIQGRHSIDHDFVDSNFECKF